VRFLRNKTGNQYPVAIFHLSVKPISRSTGRSATAAAAYRSGEKITDERTGEIHDYTRKGGVESADIVLPDGAPEWATNRAKLWNAAELAEKRKDACVAREFEVALPAELSPAERRNLALDFAKDMANREGCAVDVAIHAPGKEGDNRNHHAHILRTTRKVEADGLGAKLDTEQAGRKRKDDLEQVRERWADLSNKALERAGHAERVDHRSLKEQGIDREPTVHLGPAASGYERRTGEPSDKRIQQEREASDRIAKAKEAGQLERDSRQLDRSIIDLSGDLKAAIAERDRKPEVVQAAASGMADFRAQFELHRQAEAGKQQAAQAFQRFKAEQELARAHKAEAAEFAKALQAEQQKAAEAKQQTEIERQQPKPDRGYSR
jgi:ATP-dependent exoDNAse (exonuclease V) alpha subunit